MDRVVKEHLAKDFYFQLDIITRNDILEMENDERGYKKYILGKYIIIIYNNQSKYVIRQNNVREELFSLYLRKNDYSLVYRSSNALMIVRKYPDLIITKRPLNNIGYITNVYKNSRDKIICVDKTGFDKSQNIFVLYDYIYIDEKTSDKNEEMFIIYGSIDYLNATNNKDVLVNVRKKIDHFIHFFIEDDIEEALEILLDYGIFGYLNKNGKLNLITSYSLLNDTVNLFSKTNPGETDLGEPITKEEQQYLIEEVEKLYQDPLNYDIVW